MPESGRGEPEESSLHNFFHGGRWVGVASNHDDGPQLPEAWKTPREKRVKHFMADECLLRPLERLILAVVVFATSLVVPERQIGAQFASQSGRVFRQVDSARCSILIPYLRQLRMNGRAKPNLSNSYAPKRILQILFENFTCLDMAFRR